MKVIRSFLFIPGDSDKKLGKADSTGADALILDLEDAVTPQNKPTARKLVPAFLRDRPKGTRKSEIWVRINPLDTEFALARPGRRGRRRARWPDAPESERATRRAAAVSLPGCARGAG